MKVLLVWSVHSFLSLRRSTKCASRVRIPFWAGSIDRDESRSDMRLPTVSAVLKYESVRFDVLHGVEKLVLEDIRGAIGEGQPGP